VRRHRSLTVLIRLAGILLATLAGGCTGSTATPALADATDPRARVTVDVETGTGQDRRFAPASVSVAARADVRLTLHNRSGETHNLSFTGRLEHVRTRTIIEPGDRDTVSFVAPDPGVYPFVCTVHEGMNGELRVEAVGPPP
jgi:plastocyanin